jgi:hypothetical protein
MRQKSKTFGQISDTQKSPFANLVTLSAETQTESQLSFHV